MTSTSPSPLSKRSRLIRWAIAVGLVLTIVRVALPGLITWQIEKQGTAALGAPLRIANIDLSLLWGGVVIEELSIKDGKQPLETAADLFRLKRVEVEILWRGLFKGELHIAELVVDGPFLPLLRTRSGEIELPLLASMPKAGSADDVDAEAPSDDTSQGTAVLIDDLRVNQLEVLVRQPGAVRDRLVDFTLRSFALADFHLSGDGALGFGNIAIDSPNLRIRQEIATAPEGTQESDEPSPEPDSVAPAGATQPPTLRVDQLSLERAEMTLLTDAEPLSIALSLHASAIQTAEHQKFPFNLRVDVAGGNIELRGELGLFPPAFDGALRIDGIQLHQLAASHDSTLAAWLTSGAVNLDLAIEALVDESDAAGVTLSGKLGLTDLRFTQPETEAFLLAWQSLSISLDSVELPLGGGGVPQVEIAELTLSTPEARVALPLDALAALSPPEEQPPEVSEEKPAEDAPEKTETDAPAVARVTLEQLDVTDGTIDFRDATVSPAHRSEIRQLKVSLAGVSWPDIATDNVRVSARLPGNAPLTVSGKYAGGRGNIALDLRKLSLPSFSPYAGLAALAIDGGSASLTTKVRIRGKKYVADNELVLHDLAMSSTGDGVGAFGASISVVLALLRDLDGKITLPIAVEADEDSVSSGVGTLLWAALRQAVIGTMTSPLKLVGGAVGALTEGGGMAMAPLQCVPGVVALTGAQEAHTAAIVDLLAERPGLALAVRGVTDGRDRSAIATQLLAEQLAAGTNLPQVEDVDPAMRARALAVLRQGLNPATLSPEDQAALEPWVNATVVDDERLRTLATERGEAVRDLLVDSFAIAPERIRLLDAGTAEAPGVGLALELAEQG